jgi:predicted DNA-binding WGR domain protein
MDVIDEHCKVGGIVIEPYSCVLNQTDIDANKNKFYIMQVIEVKTGFIVFIRYGRIGEVGKTITDNFKNKNDAISFFTTQFKKKTGNSFSNDKTTKFVKKAGKYFLSEMEKPDLENKEKEKDKYKDKDKVEVEEKDSDDDLNERLKFLLDLISNEKMLNNTLVKLNIDPKKMPLGKISSSQLEKANEILKKIKDILEEYKEKNKNIINKDIINKETLEKIKELSSEYYTFVPYSCGRRKPPILENSEIVDSSVALLEELKNIHITYTIIKKNNTNINRLTNIYNQLETNVALLDKECNMYAELLKYVENTHCPTHNCKLKVTDIYEINKNTNTIYDEYTKNMKNKMLLFHGSPVANWCSILKNGLLLDPSKLGVKITGKMFGYGIYWANAITKSFNYCSADNTDNTAVLAIGEVALGDIYEQYNSNYNLSQMSLDGLKKNSTRGIGQYTPENITMIDNNNVGIPNGKLKKNNNKDKHFSLLYDEFIIYNSNQYKIKYLIVVKNEK